MGELDMRINNLTKEYQDRSERSSQLPNTQIDQYHRARLELESARELKKLEYREMSYKWESLNQWAGIGSP